MTKKKTKNYPNKPSSSDHSTCKKIWHYAKQCYNAKKNSWRRLQPTEKTNIVIAAFTGFITVFTIIYALVTIGLYHVSQKGLIISQQAFVYAESPVIFGGGNKPGPPDPNIPVSIIVPLRNSGQTPARKMFSLANYAVVKENVLPKDFTYPIDKEKFVRQNRYAFVAPKGTAEITIPLPTDTWASIKATENNLFVYGVVTYQDVFNNSHKSLFCWKYIGYVSKIETNEIGTYLFANCPSHNCYDNDCDNQ
jgi:hypothetical protein